MKNFKGIFALGVLTLCLAATEIAQAAEDHNAQIKTEMVQNYLLWEVALKNRDAERIISFESPEFIYVMENDHVHYKAQADETTRARMNNIRKVYNAKVYIKKINIEPHRVVIWASRELEADFDPLSRNRKTDHVAITKTTRDTWVRYKDNWTLKRVENLTSHVIFNGEPVPEAPDDN